MRWLIGMCAFCTLIVSTVSLAPARAQPPDEIPNWEYLGLDGTLANGVTFQPDSGDLIFVTTEEGFHYYDLTAGIWTSRDEPGSTDRAVRSLMASGYPHSTRVITGRVDDLGNGYIELSFDMGVSGEVVYQSAAGAVVDIERVEWPLDRVWACTLAANDTPGELLRSTDLGLTWTVVPGHGLSSLTDVVSISQDEIYVAGDAGVARTLDGGDTWELINTGLPAGPVHCLWEEGPIPVILPAKGGRTVSFILASTDNGLYFTYGDDINWQQVLSDPCRDVQHQNRAGSSIAGDHILAVTFDGRVLFCQGYSWEWEDWTTELGPLMPLALTSSYDYYFLATATSGVYATVSYLSDVPEAPVGLRLTAAPNPFNPATELRLSAPRAGVARLAVYDLAGRLLETLLDGPVAAGPYMVTWRPDRLASGVYLAQLTQGGQTTSMRLILAR